MPDLTFDGAMQLFQAQQSDPFPVSFDDAWQWLGYTRKDSAKDSLLSAGFIEGIDYWFAPVATGANQKGGHNREDIRLTIDCFKEMGMLSRTEQGRQIRRYFLECERIAKMKASAPNLQDVADPFWNLVDAAMSRNIDPAVAIDLHHKWRFANLPVDQSDRPGVDRHQNLPAKQNRSNRKDEWTDRIPAALEALEGEITSSLILRKIGIANNTANQMIAGARLREMGYYSTRLYFDGAQRRIWRKGESN